MRETYQRYSAPQTNMGSSIRVYSRYPAGTAESHNIPSRLFDFFLRRKNADHRERDGKAHRKVGTDFGFRVRELNIKGVGKIVIKLCHGDAPLVILKSLRQIIDLHNKYFKNEPYLVKKPIAYPLGGPFIAMSKITAPSIEEIIGIERTKRGNDTLSELAKQNKIPYVKMEKQLELAFTKLSNNTSAVRTEAKIPDAHYYFKYPNVVLAGYKEGKFIFVPLIDTF